MESEVPGIVLGVLLLAAFIYSIYTMIQKTKDRRGSGEHGDNSDGPGLRK